LSNRYLSSSLAVASIAFFAFYEIDGRPAGLVLWQLFGSTNQLLAGLALLVVSLYLIQRGRFSLPCLLPAVFMMISTLTAMSIKLAEFLNQGQYLLAVVGGCIASIAVWLVVEAALALRRYRREGKRHSLEIALPR
jgi:carbon starvation protein